MAQTEDIPYEVDDFALEDPTPENDDEDQGLVNDATIKEILAYCKKAIREHNSFDVLNIPQNATPEEKCAVFDEMFNHKGIVHHLRQIQEIITSKVEEQS